MASLSGNEPVSAENLKSAVGNLILGGSVLYDNSKGAQSGTSFSIEREYSGRVRFIIGIKV